MTSSTSLKTYVTDKELGGITTPYIIDIIKSIKQIQQRMKDPEIASLEYIKMYDVLGKEFYHFSERHTKIFTEVLQKKNLNTVVSVLYYKDKVEKGELTEEQLQNMLAEKYLPKHLKEEADSRIKEMKERGEI
ncbi:hypothetical protein [Acanthamoeba castellanii mimivirus]|uniref:Uncharacterized protein L384 n=5 Tax=Mimivirus TaxID=315393 RepID=YL384_MIMIV|nr:hypothetical protein MIMI_gp0415 [Acanthamoeba polyphaga mimivirus]Q5UQW9.1 RecName: Full=Uncharacterized protein L384 [Acanthamoeba polyphaga mimivirus]AEQ60573.1 hypothetical protein [Acanthamoeba castellanii mamavirus]AHA45479.1 hypothetical protein HIRU_S573 [Hirudovirus strain Sangsue]AHJ40085.1 hypothetical protein [Samba virus]ALR83964.1 hypothetical protein [Niemeyer virus]AMZ02829.1 hypothetical protein [Mimivirus Bombay]EJN40825.1 hypothetical protein lvs_L321 [Acanthamoeba poly